MKIIKEPKASDWSYQFTCKKCKAELEANATDISYFYSQSDGPYPSSEVYSVSCPVCQDSQGIPHDKMTEIVKIEAKKRQRHSTYSSGQWGDH